MADMLINSCSMSFGVVYAPQCVTGLHVTPAPHTIPPPTPPHGSPNIPACLPLPLQAMEAPAFWQLFQRQVSVLCVSEVQQSLLGLACLGSRAIMALLANLCRANSCRYLAPQQRLLLEPWEEVRFWLQAWHDRE